MHGAAEARERQSPDRCHWADESAAELTYYQLRPYEGDKRGDGGMWPDFKVPSDRTEETDEVRRDFRREVGGGRDSEFMVLDRILYDATLSLLPVFGYVISRNRVHITLFHAGKAFVL
jgi:hypothetical protein